MTLKELAQRMRCSQCGKKAAEIVAAAKAAWHSAEPALTVGLGPA